MEDLDDNYDFENDCDMLYTSRVLRANSFDNTLLKYKHSENIDYNQVAEDLLDKNELKKGSCLLIEDENFLIDDCNDFYMGKQASYSIFDYGDDSIPLFNDSL